MRRANKFRILLLSSKGFLGPSQKSEQYKQNTYTIALGLPFAWPHKMCGINKWDLYSLTTESIGR